ncbi:MAG: HAMP domain-containing protein [Spirochaetaceae bacterium]|nr:MAG: HAMP domain-containing protein [Spirochaetaceae bacterium]
MLLLCALLPASTTRFISHGSRLIVPSSSVRPLATRPRSLLLRLLLIVLCAVTPVLGVVLWTGFQLQRIAHEQEIDKAVRALTSIENQQRLVFHSSRQLLVSLSLWPSIFERNTERLNALLADQLAVHETYATILMADRNGLSFASAHPGTTGFSVADRDYFQRAMETGRFSVGSLVSSRTTGSPVVPFALPVFDDAGAIDSIIIASHLIDDYNALFSGGFVPPGWTAEIIDRNGVYLFRYPLYAATPLGISVQPSLLALIRSSPRVRGMWTDPEGREEYIVSAAISADPTSDHTDLYLMVRTPAETVFRPGRGIVWNLLILAVLSLVFAGIVTTVLGRRTIIRRLNLLVAASDAIACGDLSVRSGVAHDRGEIGAVAAAFDAMAEALQAREDAHDIAEQTISAALTEKEVLLQEVHHRVKNNFQIVSSLLRMQSEGFDDKVVRAKFRDAENRIRSMALIHESLYQSESTADIDFQKYLVTVVQSIHSSNVDSSSEIEIDVHSDPVHLSLDRAVPLALIVNELVSNSCKHAFVSGDTPFEEPGRIVVRLTRCDRNALELLVADNGRVNGRTSNRVGLGTQLVQALTEQLQGSIEYSHEDGTRCRCRFPA